MHSRKVFRKALSFLLASILIFGTASPRMIVEAKQEDKMKQAVSNEYSSEMMPELGSPNALNNLNSASAAPVTGNNTVVSSVYDITSRQAFSLLSGPSTYTGLSEAIGSLISLPANSSSGKLDMSLKGNTTNNILGNKGNFEELSSWSVYGGSMSQSQVLRVFGNNSLMLSSNPSSDIFAYTPTKLDVSKYYVFSGYALSAHNMCFTIGTMATTDVGGGSITQFNSTDTFSRKAFKFKPTQENLYLSCYVYPRQNEQAVGAFDGLMLNEITKEEFESLSVDELTRKYPYVDNVKSRSGGRIRSLGKNLFSSRVFEALKDAPIHNGRISLQSNQLVFTSTNTDAYTESYDLMRLPESKRSYALRISSLSSMYFRRTIEGLTSGTTSEVVFFYDESYNFISLQNINSVNGEQVSLLNVPANARYLALRIGATSSGQTVYF